MKKKSIYVWSLLVAMLTMTACSSDQNGDVDSSAKETGTFEFSIDFAGTSQAATRTSTAIPVTDWNSIKQIQFFLYDAVTGNITFSAIETPATGTVEGTARKYSYATVPAGSYTLVAVANAQSSTDVVTTYSNGTAQLWTVANVYNRNIAALDIRYKTGTWGAKVPAVAGHTAYTQPSEVFMGSATGVVVASNTVATAAISLKREVSLMRVRVDQSNTAVANTVEFTNVNTAVMLYNLPDKMGIQQGNSGGVVNTSTVTNVLSVEGAFSTAAADYLDGNFTSWKDVVVFPNNGGRAYTDPNADAGTGKAYFIVLCGIAKPGHVFSETDSNGDPIVATGGEPVFWYGQIGKVFAPNTIREVNLVLKTGGIVTPPPGVIEYGALNIIVSTPEAWDSNIQVSTIEM